MLFMPFIFLNFDLKENVRCERLRLKKKKSYVKFLVSIYDNYIEVEIWNVFRMFHAHFTLLSFQYKHSKCKFVFEN